MLAIEKAAIREQNDIFRLTEWISTGSLYLCRPLCEIDKLHDWFVDELMRKMRSFWAFDPSDELHERGEFIYHDMLFRFQILYLNASGEKLEGPESPGMHRALYVEFLGLTA